jgi:hypothetical protein
MCLFISYFVSAKESVNDVYYSGITKPLLTGSELSDSTIDFAFKFIRAISLLFSS